MTKPIRRARTATFEHTISGLPTKRADLYGEAEGVRSRLAEINNDVAAIDRVLGTLGYGGALDAVMPRPKRAALFRSILDKLRVADTPMTSRELAGSILAVAGHDTHDRHPMNAYTKHVLRALKSLRDRRVTVGMLDDQDNTVWVLRADGPARRCG